jgi:hypothetical protein
MNRKARKSIRMRTHNDYTLGMVLVRLNRDAPAQSWGINGDGNRQWRLLDWEDGVKGRMERHITVTTTYVNIDGEIYSAEFGPLVLISGDGAVAQYPFETDAQSPEEMQAAIDTFLAARQDK